MNGDQPSLHSRLHLTFTAGTIQRSAYDVLDTPLLANIFIWLIFNVSATETSTGGRSRTYDRSRIRRELYH